MWFLTWDDEYAAEPDKGENPEQIPCQRHFDIVLGLPPTVSVPVPRPVLAPAPAPPTELRVRQQAAPLCLQGALRPAKVMSTTVESILSENEDFVSTHRDIKCKTTRRYDKDGRLILRAKENFLKSKYNCNRALKKKLKKYKLRKDGIEDPEVLDVSQCLTASLMIRSPTKYDNNNEFIDDYEELKQNNYLMKMAKEKSSKCNSTTLNDEKKENSKIKEFSSKSSGRKSDSKPKKTRMLSENSKEMDSTVSSKIENVKEMNAFQVLMNARNKSIGSNSPGKEKSAELTEDEIARKEIKVKRNLALERMAEAKGSIKNKLKEACRDEEINVKMDQRAKRLKKMLTKNSLQKEPRETENINNNKKHLEKINDCKKRRKSLTNNEITSKRLKTESENNVINLDDDEVEIKNINQKEMENFVPLENALLSCGRGRNNSIDKNTVLCGKITMSDAEFLSKLSHSIKKKESMLSYFGKVEKNGKEIDDTESVEEVLENVIKVKFTPKRKSKKQKFTKKKCLDEDISKEKCTHINGEHKPKEMINKSPNINDIKLNDVEIDTYNVDESNSIGLTKAIVDVEVVVNVCDESPRNTSCNGRPRRSTKKPVKYGDSDDDMYIFTPKKKKNKYSAVSKLNNSKRNLQYEEGQKIIETKKEKKKKEGSEPKKPTKIAPIFAQKPQLTKAEQEAKQRFLHSGIPDQLKKIVERQKNIDFENNSFPVVHHVQQKSSNCDDFNPWELDLVNFNLEDEIENRPIVMRTDWNFDLKFESINEKVERKEKRVDVKVKLQIIKNKYPKFPVYRTFRLLKEKCRPGKGHISEELNVSQFDRSSDLLHDITDLKEEDPNILNWTEKFRPNSSNDIIGNFEAVRIIKSWLTTFKENTDSRTHRLRSDSTDSSDFYYSDTDSRDSMRSYNNVLVITGPVGCGKTSSIYAVATELAIKVIEVNASSKRTGKKILSDLQEATQSHKVNRLHSSENSQNSQELCGPQIKKKNKHLKTYSKKSQKQHPHSKADEILSGQSQNESCRTGMSLILVDDADLVFEQDDGFISALSQIVHSSKRPVIIVTSSVSCQHLQRFINSGNVVKFLPLAPKMLGTWLDILCLVENGDIWDDMGMKLLDYCKGDVRKAINTLQFWIASSRSNNVNEIDSKENSQESTKASGIDIDDDCSVMSWTDQEQSFTDNDHKNIGATLIRNLFSTFLSFSDHDIGIRNGTLQFPVNNLNLWYNIPRIIKIEKSLKYQIPTNGEKLEQGKMKSMQALSKLLDVISMSDFLSSQPSDVSVTSNPWTNKLCDSVSEVVNMSSYNRNRELADSISYAMLNTSVRSTLKAFGSSEEEFYIDYTLPGMAQMRTRDRIINRHKGLYDGCSLSSQLERRALATDYWPGCRQICRIEKAKSEYNVKRNNRFCHYLSAMKGSKSENLELLCDSLCFVEEFDPS